jgi:hypothetical protein
MWDWAGRYSFRSSDTEDGIAMQDSRGYNPYKFGMAGVRWI